MSMSHSISKHFLQFLLLHNHSQYHHHYHTYHLFLGFHKGLQWFFYTCNTISVLVWSLILHIVLQIWVKFLSVLFLLWCFCYDCDSSEDCNKLYNDYCKLLSKNGSGTNKSQILLETLIQILILDIQSLHYLNFTK